MKKAAERFGCRFATETAIEGPLARMRAFKRAEHGAMSLFTLFMTLSMLMIGGLGIDLMMVEMKRTKLQATLDRGVLAAANRDVRQADAAATVLAASDIVNDYVAKAGLSEYVQDPVVNTGLNFTEVTAEGEVVIAANFLKLLGVDTLNATAIATAEERVENIEISLVLDISGSMRFGDRITALRAAANDFVSTVLSNGAEQKTSINLVPYAGMTNPGPVMFDYLNGVRYSTETGVPQMSSCIEIINSDFDDRLLPNGSDVQVPHFMNWTIAADVMDWGWCPEDDSAITYASNDETQLRDFITNMRMHDGTGTHYGLKWAVSLLDPSARPAFAHLASEPYNLVPDEFADRPLAFDQYDSAKYIVLMTDGKVTEQVRPIDPLDPENAVDELNNRSGDRVRTTNRSENVQSLYSQCELAKTAGMIVFTIAYETDNTGEQEMENCASSPNHFFEADQLNVEDVFQSVARTINQLRLTQ